MDLPAAPTPPSGGNGASDRTSDRTSSLLNLLKFSGNSAGANSQKQFEKEQPHKKQPSLPQNPAAARLHQPAPAGADPSGLLAALIRGNPENDVSAPSQSQIAAGQASNPFSNGSPPADTRSYLLNLLNRPKPSQTDQPSLTESGQGRTQSPKTIEKSHELYYEQQQYQMHAHNAYGSQQQQQQQQQPEPFTDARQPTSNGSSYPYNASQDAQTDMSAALYQQLIGRLAETSPQSPQALAGANAAPLHILKRDQGSPAGHHLREQSATRSNEQSPHASPRDQASQHLDRAVSYQSQHSSQPPTQTSPSADLASGQHNQVPAEPMSSPVGELTNKADSDARETVAIAEQQQAPVDNAPTLDSQTAEMHPLDNADESVSSNVADSNGDASKDLKTDLFESQVLVPIATSVRVLAEEDQAVADSWESADQDEILVIEEPETPPVKVYNFPMKPWISISLQEDATDPRPQFREESIMDIARLKKDFDQIDRNLYTASRTYMTYGMSKQGGLRVIRQDDGKDAKVFTDTKDRIFNVGMSVTPPDHEGPHKEAIIGTGISGTVYWVQLKEGDKDHIDDAHLEQYGFALPPVSTQEGDAPGGALKTRARASTGHPEFFAVGRGKCINFIWPAHILQNNLFKPGHDRVADTERLFNECSLKINTGKAGKDFTFSQDDTVVVSLDKSGRVKFWDVRDLTTAKEGTAGRSPLPAHNAMEVKEPLMTLASTPEGEKAWPTSVLLLDKLRPYQKRCALRYMIVGMKQNHTLQLWDLALGKPVQEFNLPHSKESDAVCSVMYHPASGMIVIGHPTRNSIYFAHLSAPKYNLRSVSQADYIQRLVSQDSSISQPDSTAVISGVREYSFANRGVLRSLDILCNPAMMQDADEPTLFELYAMHSKGVACMLIKQHELGWSKDNKVLQAIDAVTEGVVTVSKLKAPQATEIHATSEARPSNRSSAKEGNSSLPSSHSETSQRALDSSMQPNLAANKSRNDGKDNDAAAQSSRENQPERPEKKSRKKKSAASKEAESSSHGSSATVRDGQSDKMDSKGINGISSDAMENAIANLETRLSAQLSDMLKSSFRNMQSKIDEGVRVRDESFNHHQIKLLDMVSEVLNENTQHVLESLIHRKFTELVIPTIGEKTSKVVTDTLSNKLQPSVVSAVQKEIQSAMPQALKQVLRSGELSSSIAERISPVVSSAVQRDIASTLTQRLAPTLNSVATQSAQRAIGDLQQQHHDQLEQFKVQHMADSNKIDQLRSQVNQLTDMVSNLVSAQSLMQSELYKLKQQPVHELPGVSGNQSHHVPSTVASHGYASNNNVNTASHPPSFAPSQTASNTQPYMGSPQYMRGQQHMRSPHGSSGPSENVGPANNVNALAGAYAHQMNKSEVEADNDLNQRIQLIEQAIDAGRLHEAIIQWVQSGKEAEIFRRSLSRYPAAKFANLPPLMLLVVIATISKDLKPNPRLKEEVEWIEMAVHAFADNIHSHEWEKQGTRDVTRSASQTMQLLVNRIRPLIANMEDGFPTDPFLISLERGKLEWIIGTSEHILSLYPNQRHYE
ncbi:WD40 repeat-like-containing domain protein [Cordyceps fumosorosea ARSEF 2679]|uniref:WD40 repeat-like-containing domain protein n=1 Tax=Cordyceps fumosorosea (strain ARSEF 2679) TaxID=1081104 RepID=A0A162LF95_CORFA|nr:WD40 repeat-like-containing domain protein [Cordyceps fumosorosea ARSEF 2679]OAA69814.1 WD40 repeat-like-containing domain protein [Cordyceps fumosorosea ARSEF 2679]